MPCNGNAASHRRLGFLANITQPAGAQPIFRTGFRDKQRTLITFVNFAAAFRGTDDRADACG